MLCVCDVAVVLCVCDVGIVLCACDVAVVLCVCDVAVVLYGHINILCTHVYASCHVNKVHGEVCVVCGEVCVW